MSQLFQVVDLDDPATIRTSASSIAQTYVSASNAYRDTTGTWSAIQGQYVAEEGPQVHSALQRPQTMVTELSETAGQAASALQVYADSLDELRGTRTTLLADIDAFRQEGVDDGGDDDVSARDEKIDGLRQRCLGLAQAKDEAQNRCADQLGGLSTSAATGRGQESVPRADEAADMDSRRSAWEYVDDSLGITPGDTFGRPLVDRSVWAVGHGLSAIGWGATHQRYADGRFAPRQGWPPRSVQSAIRGMSNATGRMSRVGGALSRAIGWDPGRVANAGSFVAKNSPQNPYKPLQSPWWRDRETPRAVMRRSLSNMRGNNHVANPGNARGSNAWGTASRWAGRAGTGVSAVTSGVGQWKEDSARHPDMGTTEQTARAVTTAAATTAGAAAGAKTGAAVGAAVGSLVPGPGTAVGAVAGGIVGGIIGSSVGQRAGDAIKGGAGKVADTVGEAVSDVGSKAKSAWNSVFG